VLTFIRFHDFTSHERDMSSVSNGSWLPGCGPVRVVIRETGVPTGFGDGLEPDHGAILQFLQLWLQLSICVLIVSQHNLYMKCPH